MNKVNYLGFCEIIFIVGIGAFMVGFALGENLGYRHGIDSVACPVCEVCGYRLPGMEVIDTIETVTPKDVLKKIAMIESHGRHYAVITGLAGERGMFQIHPIHGDECNGIGDVSLIENNVRCADLIYQNCLRKHKGNENAALCCYNGAEPGCDYAERRVEQ